MLDLQAVKAKYGLPAAAAIVHKGFIGETLEVKQSERAITHRINTDAVDRDKEVVDPKGGMTDEYLTNPVVQWAHDYHIPPIGRNMWLRQEAKGWIAKTQFAETELAEELYKLYAADPPFLRAWSIGFMTLERHAPTVDEIKSDPRLAECRSWIDKWVMLEYSGCPIGSNPEALTLAIKQSGLALSPELQAQLGVHLEKYSAAVFGLVCLSCSHEEKASTDVEQYCPICGGWMAKDGVVEGIIVGPGQKPYPNEHACRLKDPAAFDSCRRGSRSHNGKTYGVIYCRKGSGSMVEQAYRYPKSSWSAAEAAKHCKEHGGTFEAARDAEPQRVKAVVRLIAPAVEQKSAVEALAEEMLKARGKV